MQKQNRKRYSGGTKQLIKQTVINVIFKKKKTKQNWKMCRAIIPAMVFIPHIFVFPTEKVLQYLFVMD